MIFTKVDLKLAFMKLFYDAKKDPKMIVAISVNTPHWF
jgi:hypothetical protein